MFCRDVFDKLGGYDESLAAFEDYDLQARLERARMKIGTTGSRILHDESGVTLAKHLMKKRYYARYARKYLRKHGRRAIIQLLPVRGSFLRRGSPVLRHPKYILGVFTLKMLEFAMSAITLFA